MKIISVDPKWSRVSDDIWLAAFLKKLRDNFHPDIVGIIPELLAHFPEITGRDGAASHPAIPVVLTRNRHIAPHQHPEHLIIYYPVGHPCKLLADGESYTPVRNTAVYLPPMCPHSVQKNKNRKPRLSLALRWKSSLCQ